MRGYTNGRTDKISRFRSHGRIRSRRVYATGYILCSLQRRFFTRRELAAYLTQPLLASAAADRQIIRSHPIKGSRCAARTRTYIRGTFVLSRNGIIVHTVGTRYFDYAEYALSWPSAHACNSSLIATAELSRSRKNWFSVSRIERLLLTLTQSYATELRLLRSCERTEALNIGRSVKQKLWKISRREKTLNIDY